MASATNAREERAKGGLILRSTFIQLCAVVTVVCLYLSQSNKSYLAEDAGLKKASLFRNTVMPARSSNATTGSRQSPGTDYWREDIMRQLYNGTPSEESAVIPINSTQDSSCTISPPNIPCKPVQRVVYVKTHKTASTTMASILERFGYLRNLSFALGKSNHILSSEQLFTTSMPFRVPNRTRTDFDMLVNHVRYNRKDMDIAVPNAKYVSILRNPVSQLESAFGYFEMARHLKIKTQNPFETFMTNPLYYYQKKAYFWTRSRNGQLYDFGFDHKYDEDKNHIQSLIDKISQEIDLMMITEYFDESLILFRKLMCWDFEDILYISNGIRSKSHRYTVTDEIARKIRTWSAGDVMLYEHFNRTLWKKVAEYGPQFQKDLAHFTIQHLGRTSRCGIFRPLSGVAVEGCKLHTPTLAPMYMY
ncbi:galactosylceramide sulfotransferase-like [Diadema antillarum]|uniref:galactosylceramide sulfotransferase-like n=1 Tax=Diadema antillarum TaxID=105358 RepID=UPI003A851003